jgi:hypothetical protein
MEMIPRRGMVVASLLATAATSLRSQSVEAAGVDASMTQVVQADAIPWKQLYNFPDGTAEQASMHGMVGEPGQYFVLIRWHPGYMSAPHFYETDRLCVVLSGTWGSQAARTSHPRVPFRSRPGALSVVSLGRHITTG